MYRALSPGQFRLLLPDRGGHFGGTLETHQLNRCPKYIALSYTWGRAVYRKGRQESATYNISIAGEPFAIQENLHDALEHLLHRVAEQEKYIFIDAISINQEDLSERSSQVRMMRSIYERADQVWGWLSLPFIEEETRQGLLLMQRFNRALHDGLEKNDDDMNKVSLTLSADDPALFPFPATDTYKGWLGIMEMFNNPYWGRTWVQQEATGPVQTYYWCGNHSFDKVYLSAALYFGYHYSLFTNIEERFVSAVGASGSAWNLSTMRGLDGSFARKHEVQLLYLLHTFRNTRCTDSRDKVFAPRNLATDVDDHEIIADYTQSTQEVYEGVVRFQLKRYQNLDFLDYVTLPAEESPRMHRTCTEPALPGWIPDWRDRLKVSPLSLAGVRKDPISPVFHAAGSHKLQGDNICGSELTVTGMVVDQIASLSSICDAIDDAVKQVKAWSPPGAENKRYAPTRQSLDEAFRSAIVANVNYETRKLGSIMDWSLWDERIDQLSAERNASRYGLDNVLYQVCFGRRLAFTEGGRIGIVPAASKIGDAVSVLWGGQLLYTLRKVDSTVAQYRFIGSCYIHGLMHGEALDLWPGSEARKMHLV
ncbi:MAG: hypothetical protein M1821_006098 [Bathelium mastoideum]|nr:MAG: hypothetical protein M1821_006098 [Bathelium mastoideum]